MHFSDFSTISYEFLKFTRKTRKGLVSFAERSLERLEPLQIGPWPGSKGETVDWPDSGKGGRRRRGPRGQGTSVSQGAPDGEFGWAQDGQRRLVGDGAEHGGGVNGDGGAPAREW